jgi:hypothetical protein
MSCQTNDYSIGICCFSTKHTALSRKSKDCWLRIWIMCPSGLIVSLYNFIVIYGTFHGYSTFYRNLATCSYCIVSKNPGHNQDVLVPSFIWIMCPSGLTCLPANSCFISSNGTCSRSDTAEQLLMWFTTTISLSNERTNEGTSTS